MTDRGRRDAKPGRRKSSAPSAMQPAAESLWSVPVQVADIPASGRRVELAADPATRQAVASAAGVVALPRLEAVFDLAPLANDGLRVCGLVTAAVEQTCVVTLEPVTNQVEEKIDLMFIAPGPAPALSDVAEPAAAEQADPPEVLQHGSIDLGALAVEFLLLGIDPYPRKPGVSFEPPRVVDDPAAHPFAVLAALKKDSGAKQR